MDITDERTDEQKRLYPILVVGTDPCLSGWGKAQGGVSYAAWACSPGYVDECVQWVRSRGDMRRVRVVRWAGGRYRPRARGHLHIYLWRPWAVNPWCPWCATDAEWTEDGWEETTRGHTGMGSCGRCGHVWEWEAIRGATAEVRDDRH